MKLVRTIYSGVPYLIILVIGCGASLVAMGAGAAEELRRDL